MACIELVIKIPEDSYKATCDGCMLPPDVENVVQGIKKGTLLPKGHGRLIDESQITQVRYHDYISKVSGWQIPHCFIDGTDAPTIIEADTESEDKA